jgi:hypothetical protein
LLKKGIVATRELEDQEKIKGPSQFGFTLATNSLDQQTSDTPTPPQVITPIHTKKKHFLPYGCRSCKNPPLILYERKPGQEGD